MALINTAYIKKHVTCSTCNGTDLKRVTKQTVLNTVDRDGNIIVPEKLTWRAFRCKKCEYSYPVHTVDDGTKLESGEAVPLPFTCFDFYIEWSDEYLWLWFWLDEKTRKPDVIATDDIRDEHIRNIQVYFAERGIYVANTMECCWEVTFSPGYKLTSFQQAWDILHEATLATGAKHMPEEEESFKQDNAEMVAEAVWEDGIWDIPKWGEDVIPVDWTPENTK